MKTPSSLTEAIGLLRTLAMSCIKETPSLPEIERICETSYEKIISRNNPKKTPLPDNPSIHLKATFVALTCAENIKSRFAGSGVITFFDQEKPLVGSPDQTEFLALMNALRALHHVQQAIERRYS